MIDIRNVTKQYGPKVAVQDLSLHVPSGDYWLGVISGPQPSVAAFAYDPVTGSRATNANPYAAGPTDPFGPIVTDNAQMSLYLVYDVAGP